MKVWDMLDVQSTELRQNFHYFQSVVSSLMAEHAGKYVLLHNRSVVEVYSRIGDALQAGCAKYADGLFSIQRVIDRPLDLGFMSYGNSDGTTF